jgi:aspartokinase-like uncharacterized kinase
VIENGPAADLQSALSSYDLVVKIGGALLRDPASFARVTTTLGTWFTRREPRPRIVVVPGGGPFADAVRGLPRDVSPDDDTAHWMAILAMDQYAHLLAARIPHSVLVDSATALHETVARGRIGVLAPYRWLRAADPLPHSWSVTADSIAAWVATAIDSTTLILVKTGAGPLADVADPYISLIVRSTGERRRPLHVRVATPRDLDQALDGSPIRVRCPMSTEAPAASLAQPESGDSAESQTTRIQDVS